MASSFFPWGGGQIPRSALNVWGALLSRLRLKLLPR